ncbi:MAG: phosphate propanoyltransferase [Nanoarchaeota archaeon]
MNKENINMDKKIPIEISARHIHLSKQDFEELFGADYKLNVLKQLSQPGEFAAEETLTIKLGQKIIENVRIIGPLRKETQIEILQSDARILGINPPVRVSGDLENTPGLTIASPKKEITINRGVIISRRHLHCNLKEAEKLGLKNGMIASVKTNSSRPVTFHDIIVRVSERDGFCLHIDIEEGNCAGIKEIGEGIISEIIEESGILELENENKFREVEQNEKN